MALKDYVYESDTGVTFQVRIDTDQATLAGGVVGTSDVGSHVRVSSTKREFGVQPRFITAKRLVGTAPNEFTKSTKLAICTPAAYAAISVGATVTINGTSYVVGSKTPEILR